MNDMRSVQRCLSILRSFRTSGPRGQPLSMLAQAAGLPHSTVLRFLVALEREGYVRREDKWWSLTPQVLEIGFAALANSGVNDVIQASLQSIADRCHGTVNIGERNRDEVIIIARTQAESERRQILVVNLRVGSTLPRTSALYSALGLADDAWVMVHYTERKLVTLGMSLVTTPARSLSLGLSVDSVTYPQERIEQELVPMLRSEREQIRRLLGLGGA